MPPVNDLVANAITLSLPNDTENGTTVGSVTGGSWDNNYPNVWYRVAPTEDVTIRFSITKTAGAANIAPWIDIYLLIAADPPTSWWSLDWIAGAEEGVGATVALQGGQVYYIDVYGSSGYPTYIDGEIDFTLAIEYAPTPDGDHVANAILVNGGETVFTGSTVYATYEPGETDELNSIWYRIHADGPGNVTIKLEGLNGFIPMGIYYHKTGGGIASSYYDLNESYPSTIGDGTSSPRADIYESDPPSGLYPLLGGENVYLKVSKWDYNDPEGEFRITIHAPTKEKCLQAKKYINPNATTATEVANGVSVDQYLILGDADPHKAWPGEYESSLIIPGEDITNTPGFFAVSIKTVNNNQGYAALKRNGFPFLPALMDWSVSPDTEIRSWLTALPYVSSDPLDVAFLDSISTLWRFPVAPGDEIEVIIGDGSLASSPIIITEICFQRVGDAMENPPFDVINFPDYPLGTNGPPMDRGALLHPPTASEPSNSKASVPGMDMCFTDDGTLWVCHNQWNSNSTRTGPILQKWNGSNWVLINADIEGLGIRRTVTNPNFDPYSISMDTDGEDLYIVYLIDGGLSTAQKIGGNTHDQLLRVKKYDVSANSWSNVGNPVHSGGDGPAMRKNISSEAGSYDAGHQIKIAPDGTPWLAFTDWWDDKLAQHRAGFVARWDGGRWRANVLPVSLELQNVAGTTEPWSDLDFAPYTHQARLYRYASGTTSETSYLGETCVQEVQTSYTGDTIRIIPPAGKWGISLKITYKRDNTALAGGFKYKSYKNGSQIVAWADDYATYSSPGQPNYTSWLQTTATYWHTWNGTDELEIRVKRDGGTTQCYVDDITFVPHWLVSSAYQPYGNVAWVEDCQYHVQLLFNNPNNPNYPRAIWNYIANYPEWVPENTNYTDTQAGCWFQMAEWTGSAWQTVWEQMPEDTIPGQVVSITKPDGFGYIIVGHWQQGMATYYDEASGKSYLMAGLGISFHGGDAMMLAEITETGLVNPSGVIKPPSAISSIGWPASWDWPPWERWDLLYDPWHWGHDIHCKSMTIDAYGNLWAGWVAGDMAGDGYAHIIGHKVDYGTGGWVVADDHQFVMGYADYYAPVPVVLRNPAGNKIYILFHGGINSDMSGYTLWDLTLGVWECTITQNAYTPLVETKPLNLSKIKFRAYQEGDIEE